MEKDVSMGILRDKKAYLVFLLPGLLFYIFSVFYPIADSIMLSMKKWNGIGPMKWTGLANYVKMIHDRVFYQAFINNLGYVVIVVTMQLLIGLLLAVLIRKMSRGAAFMKTLYYIPCIITTVAVTQMFRSMYATEPAGLFNMFFNAVGLGTVSRAWLADIHTVLACVSIPEGWRFTGMYMVMFYAALVSLDPCIREAARIDGATGWTVFWKIELPMIRPVVLLSFIMCLTGALRGFDIPFLLTAGGPGNASELLATYMYKVAFSNNQFGYGSTLAVFIIIECLAVVFILNKSNGREHKEGIA
jgi:raffinose/stachyose/melibiose transport system permease protein